ncbi:hypothetical protein OG393_32105 [Streptomyces sp. NBC_01216]|nr:hypothetical protein OG393_32105 [Streptomyces sp. NBC_01216]
MTHPNAPAPAGLPVVRDDRPHENGPLAHVRVTRIANLPTIPRPQHRP